MEMHPEEFSVRIFNFPVPEQKQVREIVRTALEEAFTALGLAWGRGDVEVASSLDSNTGEEGAGIWLINLPLKEKALGELDSILPRLLSRRGTSLVTLVTPETFERLELQQRFREAPLGDRWYVLLTDHRGKPRRRWTGRLTEILRDIASRQALSGEHRAVDEPTVAYKAIQTPSEGPGAESGIREHQEAKRLYYRGVTDHLRKENGRLDAKRIALSFGLSLRELAMALEERPQTVDKTPDSKRLQEKLHPYEEIARAQVFLGSDESRFRKWLNTPSRDLVQVEGKNLAPIDLIKRGRPEVVAGLVDDTITGFPG